MFTALLLIAMAHAAPHSVPLDASARPDPQSFFAWMGLCPPEQPCLTLTGPAWMVATGLRRLPAKPWGLNLGNDVIIDMDELLRGPDIDLMRLIDDRPERVADPP